MSMTTIGAMLRRDLQPATLGEVARSCDGAYEELWIVEDLPWAGGIAQMGAVLGATDGNVKVGHGIAPAPFRNPAALAMEWAALAELYPGRVLAGIGHGVQSWMGQIGAKVDSPLALLAETIEVVRRLLAGETVALEGRYVTLEETTLVFPPAVIPPVSAGVRGPKSLQLAGRLADGTVLAEGNGPEEIASAKARIDEGVAMRTGAPGAAASERFSEHRLTVFAGCYVGPLVELGPPPEGMVPGWDAVSEDPAEVAAELQTAIDAGVDSLVLVPFGADPTAQLQRLTGGVVPLLNLG